MAWWPGMETDIHNYIKWCTLCSALALKLAPIGIGTRCLFPLLCWQIDDKMITDPVIVSNTGFVSILVMYEQTSGLVLFACRKTCEAWEVSHLIHTRVIQYYGVPLQILSDHAASYIKEVALTLCQIQGIPNRITCSKGSHSKGAEAAIRALSKMLAYASAKGDLRSATHLELYTANLQIKQNQLMETDGSTVFERLHGHTPITTADLLQVPHMTESQLLNAISKSKNATNSDYMQALHARSKEMISFRSEMSDTRAKWNWTNRLSKEANKSHPTLSYSIDDEVSIDGSKWLVQRIQTQPNGTPERAFVSNAHGKGQWVRNDQITTLSVPVPQNLLPISPELEVGSTIFYYDSDSPNHNRVLCGDITKIDTPTIEIHIRQHNCSVRTWLPRWTLPSRPESIHRYNYGKQKTNMIPFTDTANISDVICTSHLSDSNMLPDETIYYLQSKGIDISIAKDTQDNNV
jgi:hypothetical protein